MTATNLTQRMSCFPKQTTGHESGYFCSMFMHRSINVQCNQSGSSTKC